MKNPLKSADPVPIESWPIGWS